MHIRTAQNTAGAEIFNRSVAVQTARVVAVADAALLFTVLCQTYAGNAAAERKAGQQANVDFFMALPDNEMGGTTEANVKGLGFKQPYFEFSGACAGCGETPYVKLMAQLFGENAIIANATGCSSIYGGTFPTIPYTKTKEGRGPAWANSLFEDNAEFGLGMRIAVDTNRMQLKMNVEEIIASKNTAKKFWLLKKLRLNSKTLSTAHWLTGTTARLRKPSPLSLPQRQSSPSAQRNVIARFSRKSTNFPTTSATRACGSSVVTAGQTISVMPVSTMSWQWARM